MASELPMTGTKCVQCGKPFEGSYAAVKVGEPMWVHDTCGRAYQEAGRVLSHWNPDTHVITEPSLSLLVLDMGDCCVVKVEKGHLPSLPNVRVTTGNHTVKVVDETFPDLRAALDGEKPVPRLEWMEPEHQLCIVFKGRGTGRELIEAFSETYAKVIGEITGKPLPIWEGGKWQELMKCGRLDKWGFVETGVSVWRYTR